VTVVVGTNGTNTISLGTGNDLGFGIGGNDTITGSDGNDSLSGGSNNDTLDGGAGSDVLWGASGNDTLVGGVGADILTGGTGDDLYEFIKVGSDGDLSHYGIDQITDFGKVAGNTDHIGLDDALFTGIGATGTLNAAVFKLSTDVFDADDRIIYNQSTGALYYDVDGSGAGVAVQFAQLTAGTALTSSDFNVI
jgi:serralysin